VRVEEPVLIREEEEGPISRKEPAIDELVPFPIVKATFRRETVLAESTFKEPIELVIVLSNITLELLVRIRFAAAPELESVKPMELSFSEKVASPALEEPLKLIPVR